MSNATTVLGITFDPADRTVIVQYSLMNMFLCSVVPFPLAGGMVVVAALIWGVVGGLLINAVTSLLGAYISLVLTRAFFRPCFVRRLGRYKHKWEALDAALTAEGSQIALLIRVAPVAPFVLSNVMLSMTSITQLTYCWTTFIGIIPSNIPFAYAAALG
eukprot:2353719-Prymnesium_polylepis.1